MLNEIRDSLSHLRKNDLEGYNDLSNLQHKPELSQSTPNLLEKSAGSKMTRRDNQHHKALAEIRDSLRPYQNASNGPNSGASGAGSAGGSDNSSTNSSTSSHAASDADATSSKVQQLVQFGFDEDIAERALKLCNNKSVEAALHLLLQIMEDRLNGGRKISGLQRSTFGASSPAASETNSVRSDSPGLSSSTQQQRPMIVNGFQTPPPLPPRVPMTTNHAPRGQTPPPATDGVDSAMKSGNSLQQQSSGLLQMNHGQALNQAALLAQNQLMGQSNVVPQGHVQQMVKQIKQCYYIQQQQVGLVGQRGVSPNPVLGNQQQIMMGSNTNGSTPSPSPIPTQQLQGMYIGTPGSSNSNSSSSASSNNGAPTMPRGYTQVPPPPPYSEAQAQIQAARLGVATITGINGGTMGHVESLQQQDLHRLDNTIMSVSSETQQLIQKKLVASAAVTATRTPMGSSHLPVIMPSVRSKEVHKPVPQTATAPVVPASQNINMNGGGVPQSYISQVQTHGITGIPTQHLKQSQHTTTAVPQSATAVSTPMRDVKFQITHSHPKHQLPQVLRNGGNTNYTADQLINVTGQPTIQTRHQSSPFSPNHLQGMRLPTNNMYQQFTNDAIMSTPRSDSPVSRATNQSPMSVLSTASSPSTNSDIPDKPPPPYPGRGIVGLVIGQVPQMNPPPLLPPRIPLKEKPPPPPPPPILPEQDSLSQQTLSSQLPKYPPSQLSANFPLTPSSASSSPSPSSPGTPLPGNNLPLAIIPIHSNININIQSPPEINCTSAQNGNSLNLPGPQVVSSAPLSETDETDTDTSQGNISSSNNKCSSKSAQNEKHRCMSPLPERKFEARERDRLRSDTKVKMYSPQAFKFYMEQHVENVLKSHTQRINRRLQLEKEMAKVNLSEEAAKQMRKMLHQKESNYIRLKRAKMDSSMFEKIQPLGVGAFGEVALVRKKDVGSLYAMKTLKKSNVIKRNQVAHVKAERDILAEADNEWVVKLYYSFQDRDNLYFVMDYVPGGDLMGLLIRKEILDEHLAQFYIAELVLAIESVHRMGFIHRDIKPDNILIDRDGHIKLTDFGLCTGFRWTHNSKYYQKDGTHARQDSMEVNCQLDDQCRCDVIKPLERRRQREQKRCLAHSLVGTPNYIAPEVLLRLGYTKACDWWSVGVILYEMVIGQPPFYANTPAETQYKVINWKETLSFRHCTNLSSATRDLIVQLLQGPETRLGRNGATEVKDHPFFGGINFEGLRRQPAPFKPTIRFLTDTSNFDPVDPDKLRTNDSEGCKKVDSKLENGKHPEHAFFEFTFRRFFDDGGHPCSLPSQQDQETNSPVSSYICTCPSSPDSLSTSYHNEKCSSSCQKNFTDCCCFFIMIPYEVILDEHLL
ncbi:Serine/threonine-protein kinase lats1 [Bulinus truncatus]|nr:Serine/threonine-protein kinase lats1 [Bulinus truncatus]